MSRVDTATFTLAFCEAPTPVFWFIAFMPAKFCIALPPTRSELSVEVPAVSRDPWNETLTPVT